MAALWSHTEKWGRIFKNANPQKLTIRLAAGHRARINRSHTMMSQDSAL